MMDYNGMQAFVREHLITVNPKWGSGKIAVEYHRYEHIERVHAWVKRILSELPSDIHINEKALQIAAIFHDVGYGLHEDNREHAKEGAAICRKYLKDKGYDELLIKDVEYLIENHSNKELLKRQDTPIELIVLMEADLLDDTGALALVMDTMIVTAKGKADFHKVYEHMLSYAAAEMKANPMVTKPATQFWKEKRSLIDNFILQLKRDLNIT